jgi:hypothetical protein
MTIYDPTIHQSIAAVGATPSKLWSVNKLVLDLAAAGFIQVIASDTTPAVADQGKVWLAKGSADAATGTVKIWDGAAWSTATKALLLSHLGGLTAASTLDATKLTGAVPSASLTVVPAANLTGLVPTASLPSYVHAIQNFTNLAAITALGTGVADIIYVADDTNLTYRWSGSAFVAVGTAGGGSTAATQAQVNAGTDNTTFVTPLTLATKQQTKGIVVKSAGTQSIPNGGAVVTDLSTVVTNDFGASALSAGAFTVPAAMGGWYAIVASAFGASGNVTLNEVQIKLNGTAIADSGDANLSQSVDIPTTSAYRFLAAGDVITLVYGQFSGAAVTCNTTYTRLEILRLP